jgi:hypothetical protein
MIKVFFKGFSDKRVAEQLKAKGPQLRESLREGLDLAMLELQRRIQRKLSGEVLQQRTGKLLASIVKEPTVVTGSAIRGAVTGAGGPAFYGRIQEAGGTRAYEILPKTKKALAFFPTGAAGAGFGRAAMTRLRFGAGKRRGELRPGKIEEFGAAGGIIVKRVHHPPLQARRFMSMALTEMRERIIARVREAAAKALQ